MTLPELVKDYTDKQRANEREWEQFTKDWPLPHGKYETMEDGPRYEQYRRASARWRETLAARDAAYAALVAAEKLLKDNALDAVTVVAELVEILDGISVPGFLDSFTFQPARELLAKVGHLIPKPETTCPAVPTTSPSKATTAPKTPTITSNGSVPPASSS